MEGGTVKRGKGGPGKAKGRPVDPQALAEVQALLGDAPRRRDLLLEHLHKIQDRYGFSRRRISSRSRAKCSLRRPKSTKSRRSIIISTS